MLEGPQRSLDPGAELKESRGGARSGTARNTCDHPVRLSLEVAALTADGRPAATAWPVQRTLAAGEEVSFTSYLGILDASQRIASLRMSPTVVAPE